MNANGRETHFSLPSCRPASLAATSTILGPLWTSILKWPIRHECVLNGYLDSRDLAASAVCILITRYSGMFCSD